VTNERGPKECIELVLAIWSRRASLTLNAVRRLVIAAKSAADWLCEARKGSDPWERGLALRQALGNWGNSHPSQKKNRKD
jgi:hypothetical protein